VRVVSGSRDGDDERRRRVRPENEFPVTVGTSVLLGRTDELAVALSDLRVYRNGAEFTVSARCRGELARRGVLHMALSGRRHPRRAVGVDPFLLGFEFSDGRSVSSLREWPWRMPDDDDQGPWLTSSGGGGSDVSVDHQFFLAPLPPGDSLSVISAWPALGIAETRHVLDARAIREAAERVVELWPAEPGDVEPEPLPPPELPPGSCFGRT
jgi:hypothetical protein